MKRTKQIPDLDYFVTKVRPFFARTCHVLVMYRHDKDGRAYVYHTELFAGKNGIQTRSAARRRGREIITGQESIGLRDTYIMAHWKAEVESALEARKGQPS